MEEQQFVGFRLGDQKFGLEISNVGGIMNYEGASKVPNSPTFIEGLINVRGNIIPVISLRKRFNISEKASMNAQVILYYLNGKEIGFLVDEANQVIKINKDAIELPPGILSTHEHEYVKGIGKINNEMILLLNLDNLFSNSEMAVEEENH